RARSSRKDPQDCRSFGARGAGRGLVHQVSDGPRHFSGGRDVVNVRRGLVKLAVVVCAAALLCGAAGAAELYTYPDDNRFWWFVGTEPAFEILVPSNTGGAYPLYFH